MSKYHHKDENRIQQLKQLGFAEQSMLVAKDACALAIRDDEKMNDSERMIISAGMTTLYCSPFTQGNGIGTLDESYSRFQDSTFKSLHAALLDIRHRFYSHRDVDNAVVVLEGVEIPFHEVIIRINHAGGAALGTPYIFFRKVHFIKIEKLCEFQADRLNKKQCKLLLQLQTRHKKPFGSYTLGKDYP